MRRMVVRTTRGHAVADIEATEQELAEGVARINVDDVLVSDAVRPVMHVPNPAHAPAPGRVREGAGQS